MYTLKAAFQSTVNLKAVFVSVILFQNLKYQRQSEISDWSDKEGQPAEQLRKMNINNPYDGSTPINRVEKRKGQRRVRRRE